MEVGELLRLDDMRRAGFEGKSRVSCGRGGVRTYRSIWLSDLHFGTPRFQAEALLDFLNHHQAERLFLVGDIVDGWKRNAGWYWSPAQAAVVVELQAWRRRGTEITALPGNHDLDLEFASELLGLDFVHEELIYRTGEGRRMLVIHGHQFDRSLAAGRFWQGSHAYAMAQRIHEWYGQDWDERSARPGRLAGYLRYRVKRAVQYLTDFDDRDIFEAVRERRADGIICGHIHRPEQRLIGGVWYLNDGDWVESRTALVEDWDGSLRLLRWDPTGDATAESSLHIGALS